MRCANCHKLINRAAATVTTTSKACAGMTFTKTENYGPKCAAKLGLDGKSCETKYTHYTRKVKDVFSKSTLEVQDGQEELFERLAV